MKRLSPLAAWVMGSAGLALASGAAIVLTMGSGASARGAAPATARACPTPSAAQVQAAQQQYAQRLAQALGKSEQEVQQALQQVPPPAIGPKLGQAGVSVAGVAGGSTVSTEGAPPAGEPGKGGTVVAIAGDPEILAPAAARLGVSPQQLADAFKAAGQQLKPANAIACSGGADQIVVMQGDDADLFAAVAQQLGHGITAAQVREAMQLVQPPAAPPAPDSELKTKLDQYLQALAAALHVSVDQLQVAMQQASDCGSPPAKPATPSAGLAICFSVAGTPLPPPPAP